MELYGVRLLGIDAHTSEKALVALLRIVLRIATAPSYRAANGSAGN